MRQSKPKSSRRPRKRTGTETVGVDSTTVVAGQGTSTSSGIDAETERLLRLIPGYDPFRDAEGFHYDVAAGARAVAFFERVLRHAKGELAGKPFLLEDWQKAVVTNLWGWRRPDGTRRYRRFLIYVPKKNGKTPMAAGLILLMLCTDHEPGAEIIGAAAAKEQASYIFEHAVGMVRNSELLSKRLRIYGGRGGAVQKRICNEEEGSVYRVVSADADTFDGGNVHGAVIDELHRQDDGEFVDLLEGSDTARRNPLIGSITTADFWRPESPCNKRYEYAKDVCAGTIKDPAFLPVIYEADAADDWESEETWKKANPNYGVSVKPEAFAELAAKARRDPGWTNEFKRLYLDLRTNVKTVWIPVECWQACGPSTPGTAARDEILERFRGCPCWIGVDLAAKHDLTCVHQVFVDNDGEHDHYHTIPWFYMARENAREREREDRVPYIAWADAGWVTLTEGAVTDYEYIERDLDERIAPTCEVREIAVDPYNATQFETRAQQRGYAVVEVVQSMKSLNEPSRLFEALVRGKRWHHDGNPCMAWCVGNAITATNAANNIMPTKQTARKRIDGVAALVTGLARAMLQAGQARSVYETEGLLVL